MGQSSWQVGIFLFGHPKPGPEFDPEVDSGQGLGSTISGLHSTPLSFNV